MELRPSRSSHSRIPLLAFLVLGGCAVPTNREPVGHSANAVTVCAGGSVVKGVDVSVYQGTVNWPDVKSAGIDFAIARISDGSALDSEFATNWSAMKSAGIVRGAYQYFEPGEDPTTQAKIVVSAVGSLAAGDLPVTADMETSGGQSPATVAANLKTWVAAVQAGTGKTPMIYTAEGYWDSDVASTAFSSDPLWVANWGVSCPDLATGWSSWSVWQYSDSGSVAGISGSVDLDEFNGTLAELEAFAGGGGVAGSDAGTTGYYAAQFVSQSWPLASTPLAMTACDTIAASITLKNIGTTPWDSSTRLATTQPRDRVSLFADSTWVSDDRLAAVTGTVAPGDTFEFKFDFHAPPTAGNYTEYFGVVEDGVAWFSDPGQGGPPDDDIEANILVSAGSLTCVPDPSVPDGGKATSDGGNPSTSDGGAVSKDAGAVSDSGQRVLLPDAGPERDSGLSNPDTFGDAANGGCDAAGRPHRSGSAAVVWLLALFALAVTRRKRPPRRAA
jgi:lysozyme